MNSSQRPPLLSRKGIAVLQPSRTQKLIDSQQNTSGARSVRSSGRARGISIGRSSGIQMDKIYQQKHFPAPQQNQESKSNSNLEKTLVSCKSLKLVSLQSEASISQDKEPLTHQGIMGKEAGKTLYQEKKDRISPIGKLKESQPTSKLSQNERKLKLIRF